MEIRKGIYPTEAKKKKCPMKLANANSMQDLYCEGPDCMAWVTLFSSLPTRVLSDGTREFAGECGLRKG